MTESLAALFEEWKVSSAYDGSDAPMLSRRWVVAIEKAVAERERVIELAGELVADANATITAAGKNYGTGLRDAAQRILAITDANTEPSGEPSSGGAPEPQTPQEGRTQLKNEKFCGIRANAHGATLDRDDWRPCEKPKGHDGQCAPGPIEEGGGAPPQTDDVYDKDGRPFCSECRCFPCQCVKGAPPQTDEVQS